MKYGRKEERDRQRHIDTETHIERTQKQSFMRQKKNSKNTTIFDLYWPSTGGHRTCP